MEIEIIVIIIYIIALIVSSLAFILSLSKEIIKWLRKPKLEIEFDEIWNGRPVRFGTKILPFYCLHIRNKRDYDKKKGETAKRCIATLELLKYYKKNAKGNLKLSNIPNKLDKKHILHWSDKDYNYKTEEPEPVEIGFGESRRIEVFFSIPKKTFNAKSINAHPLNISENKTYETYNYQTYSPEAYASHTISQPISSTCERIETINQKIGSWVAVQIALRTVIIDNGDVPQAYLAPGVYDAKIIVDCNNGVRDEKNIKLDIKKNGSSSIEIVD